MVEFETQIIYNYNFSDLLDGKEKSFPEYRVIFSFIIEKDLVEGETEINTLKQYHQLFPVSISKQSVH